MKLTLKNLNSEWLKDLQQSTDNFHEVTLSAKKKLSNFYIFAL